MAPFPYVFLAGLIALATASPAVPLVERATSFTLPVTVKTNTNGTGHGLHAKDMARLTAFRNNVQGSPDNVPVTDAGQIYTAAVGVGSQTFNLIVDTGSSNTWVGAQTKYQPGGSAQDTGGQVQVSYGSGQFSGEEFTDTVTLGSAQITQQSIGSASSSQGFNGFDGILGIGPTDLTQGTVSNANTVPTVTDNLASQGTIPEAVVGVSFAPTTEENEQNGSLDFGGTDSSKFTGSVAFTPITSTSPASQFWGIDQSITDAKGNTIMKTTSGIVDTGTTLVLLPSDAFQAYQSATGATQDQATGLLTVQSEDSLSSLFFNVGDNKYEWTANAQIWPRAFNSEIGGQDGQIYLVVQDSGSNTGSGLDFINGFTFLQRFYSVYDTANQQVGFATTSQTDATSN